VADQEDVDPTNESTPSAAEPILGHEGGDRAGGYTSPDDSRPQSSGSSLYRPESTDPADFEPAEDRPGEDHLLEEDFAADAPPIHQRADDEFADDERADNQLADDELPDDGRAEDDPPRSGDPDGELVAVGAPSNKRSAGRNEAAADRALARSKKEKATPPQKVVPTKEKRTGPVTFLKESAGELRKVVYPTGQQLLNYFVVVLIFVLFIIAIVSLLDLAFGAATLKIFS